VNNIIYYKIWYKIITRIYSNMSAAAASNELCVLKRNGKREEIAFDKILNRVKKLGNKEPPLQVQYSQLVMKVIDQIYDNINTSKIDELTAEQCASLCTKHLDYGELASRIIISNNHKNTLPSFYKSMKILYEAKDIHGTQTPLLHKDTWRVIQDNKKELDEMIDYERDFLIDYFGFKTLERAYLMRVDKKVIERIQHMWLRVSVGIHGDNMKAVKETYDLMSQKYFTHATPTLYNSGTPRPQLSSCYLLGMESDSIDGIYNTLKECATISKWAGGIGLHMHNIRSTGSHIRGTNGTSNGIVPMLRVFNMTARYVDQGGGKRNGSIAIYMEPHHADICDFLDLKKNHGDEEMRARDLFYALWISDLFMEKVKKDEMWSLFCPDACPGMSDVYGDKFRELYDKYTSEGRAVRVVKARELWFKILDSQMETGTPYLLYKDAANEKSNQKNLGTIKSSNLCTEIIEYSDGEQTAVCNLASLSLTKFVSVSVGTQSTFNYDELHRVTKVVTANLNRIIDVNFYPTEKTRLSNLLHRPIGIGVQGLADVFALMDIPYHSDEAIEVNKLIFETIYHASLEGSNELARQRIEGMNELRNFSPLFTDEKNRTCRTYKDAKAKPLANVLLPIPPEMTPQLSGDLAGSYSSFVNSPASKGILQFDMWGVKPSNRYDWSALKDNIMKYGLRNSLLVAPMPTASTSQILGNNECFEPFTSNIYSRRTLAGDYVVINKYLMKELIDLGVWNEKIKDNIILNKGSIQHLEMIPKKVRDKYKIVWEIPMRHMIDMAADRGAYICQSQSLNLWVEDPDYKILTNMHFHSWGKGLKTGIYYLRRKPKHQPQQFTIGPSVGNNSNSINHENEEETCETCSA
jgi:ribonucleoside-diphosphate reductase alpha chain